MDLKQIIERLAAIGKRGAELMAFSRAGQFTSEHQTEWDALIKEKGELEAEKARLETLAGQFADMDALNRDYNQPARGSAARAVSPEQQAAQQPGNGREQASSGQRYESLGRRVTSEEALRAYRERGLATIDVGSFYHLSADDPQPIRAGSRLMRREQLALVYTGGLPDTIVVPDRVPGILTQQFVRPTVRDAFGNTPTTSNLITFVRELILSHTNAAAFVEEPSATGDTTGTKPESTLVFDDGEAPVREVATWVPMSENIVDDVPGLQSLVENRLLDFLAQAEDDALLNGDGNAPNLRGLRETSGIQVADAAYFSTNPVQDAGASNEDFNRILAAAALVRNPGLASASFVMLSTTAFQYMLTVTDANRNYLGGGPFVTGTLPRIWGIPVIETTALDDDPEIAIVGDGRMAEVRDRLQGVIDVGWIDKQFIRDMITIRAKERLAFPVYRPGAFVETTLALN
jgi:HK97 family phage major capsid protein